jgi:hypothetical protein
MSVGRSVPGLALGPQAREQDVAAPSVETGYQRHRGGDQGEDEDRAGMADAGQQREAGDREAVGHALEILVQHEQGQGYGDDDSPQPNHLPSEVPEASIANGRPTGLDGPSQTPQRSQPAERQEDEAGAQDGDGGDGDRPHRSVASALQQRPVLGTVRAKEDEVMAEDQGSQRERGEAEKVTPALGHVQTLANDRLPRHASCSGDEPNDTTSTGNLCPVTGVEAA